MSLSASDAVPPRPQSTGAGQLADAATLPPGTRLGEFELLGVLGDGGFGVVYEAQDVSLGRRVALKEYMPSSLAARHGTQVSVRSPRHADTFEAGLRSFVNEARLLASFDHPSLVKVYRFWEANGTAYMVMPCYEGVTLRQHLIESALPPTQTWLLRLLEPLIDALATIHAQSCWHRDIAPDNIILLAGSGRPLLLDFGAARRVISGMTQALTVILKPGYAPLEQYAEVPELKQGPWTDVYALCAVVHFAITGRTPPPAVGRIMNDSFQGLADREGAGYAPEFLRAIERGLRVRPDERTPTVEALAAELGLRRAVDLEISFSDDASPAPPDIELDQPIDLELSFDAPAPRELARTEIHVPSAPSGSELATETAPTAPTSTQPVAPAPAPVVSPAAAPSAEARNAEASATAAIRSIGTRWTFAGLVALAVLVGAGVATWLTTRGGGAGGAVPVAQAPPHVALAALPTVAAVRAASPAQRIAQEFDRIVAARDASWRVEAAADQPRLRIGRDRLSFKLHSNLAGFVYVLVHGPDDSLMLLFPNSVATDNRIGAGQTLTLPEKGWPLEATDPPGAENFVAIVSAHRRDFSALRPVPEAWFQRLPVDPGATAPSARGGSVFAGSAQCAAPGCDQYGAARFTVTVER